MATAVIDQPTTGSETTGNTGNPQGNAPGWLAGLPADLRDNEAFKSHKTVGDFAKAHLEVATKAKEFEGKLANSIPKLGENATQEEREKYFMSLGRPEKPEGYELDGEDKNAKEWTGYWRNELFKIGVPKDQAKAISASFNAQIGKMVEAHNANIQQMNVEAENTLKTEWGDKYAANVELVKRLWKRDTDMELDAAFAGESSANRVAMMRYVFKLAAKTGEDMSAPGAAQRGTASATTGLYPKSNMPPKK